MIDADGDLATREQAEAAGLATAPLSGPTSPLDPEKVCGCHPNMPDVPSPTQAGRECLGCGWLTYPNPTEGSRP